MTKIERRRKAVFLLPDWQEIIALVLFVLFALFVIPRAKADTFFVGGDYVSHSDTSITHRHHISYWHMHRHHWHSHAFTSHGYVLPPISVSSDTLSDAQRFIGSANPTGFRGPWCAAFVNMILRQTGHAVRGSLRAIDALLLGPHIGNPQPGDLAVMRHHVTFFVSYGGRGFYALGGNQGHRVKVSSYSIRRVIAFVRPR